MQQTLSAKLAQITIAVACASMLAACGGGGSDSNTPQSGGDTTAGGGNTNTGGDNTSGGGTIGGGTSGSGDSSSFNPSSTQNVAENSSNTSTYGSVKPVEYVLHNQDHTATTVKGQRYGDSSKWLIDLGVIQLSSNDGGNNATWGGSLVKASSRFFADQGILMACAGTWDKFTNIAIDAAATVADNTAKLAGTYTEYSCGTDGYKGEPGAFTIDSSGAIRAGDGMAVDAAALFGPNGWSPEAGLNIKARGYIVNGVKVIIMKDAEGSDKSMTVSIAR